MKNIICKSDIITLRKTDEEDLKFVINVERQPDNAQYIGQWTREQHVNALENEDILHLIVEDLNTAKAVGYVIMAGIQNANNNVEFRRM